MDPLDEFGETRTLSDAALRELLHGDDTRSRLFAVWALGLRSASLVNDLGGEPDPGVRRGLAVVLAGQGEVDLLVALCRHDPNVHVRASVSQMVVRFAKAGSIPWSIVVERLGDAPEVRAAVISQLDTASPPDVRELAVRGLVDEHEIVRREAFEVGVQGIADATALQRGLEKMSRSESSHAIAMWLGIEQPAVIAQVLKNASASVREMAIRLRPDLAFTDFLPLIADDVDLFERIGHKLPEAPVALRLRYVAARPSRDDLLADLSERLGGTDRVPAELSSLVADLRSRCRTRLEELDTEIASCTDEDERLELAEWRETVERCYERLERIWD